MFAGSLILSMTLIGFAIWLHISEAQGWEGDVENESDLDQTYHRQRSRSRNRTNFIIGFCGVLICIAAFTEPGPLWMGLWMCVSVALLTVIGLAGLDALRTHRYHNAKLQNLSGRRHRK